MADLGEKIKVALDECRMLVLGTQVLISLQFELVFQNAFPATPPLAQRLVAAGLGLLLLTFALLLWGPAYHRIVFDGDDAPEVHRFITWAQCAGLVPLALALGVDAYVAVGKVYGPGPASASAVSMVLLASLMWYAMALLAKRPRPPEPSRMKDDVHEPAPAPKPEENLHRRVAEVLTEARIVLPGAQAMLGFQFITIFSREFDGLANSSKAIHLACLGLIGLTVVLLMTPASFHRIAERGEDSERLVRVASRLVLAAMVPLALAMAGDFFVVVRKITASDGLALACAVGTLMIFYGFWFGYTSYRRRVRGTAVHGGAG